jgi:hypothetical protein
MTTSRECRPLIAAIWWSLLASGPVAAAEPAAADARLATARAYFELAEFEVALSVLDEATADPATDAGTRRDVHALRARCLAVLNRTEESIAAFCAVLGLDPAWNPDPVALSARELSVFRRAAARCSGKEPPLPNPLPDATESAPRPWFKNPLVLGGAGVIVASAIALMAAGGEEGGGETPYFPDPPEAVSP